VWLDSAARPWYAEQSYTPSWKEDPPRQPLAGKTRTLDRSDKKPRPAQAGLPSSGTDGAGRLPPVSITINKVNRADGTYDVSATGADDTALAALNGEATGPGDAGRNDGEFCELIGTSRYLVTAGVLRAQGVSGFAAPQYTGDASAYSFKGV